MYEIDQQRIHSIHNMLFEIASGNFTFRIPRTELDDELEALIVLVNMIAEELKATVSHSGYINPHNSVHHLLQNIFILDSKFRIKVISAGTKVIFGPATDFLYGIDFSCILAEKSIPLFQYAKETILNNTNYNTILPLTYKVKNELLLPGFYTVSKLAHNDEIIISSVIFIQEETINIDSLASGSDAYPKNKNRYPLPIIQEVHNYILTHLDAPLSSIKALSRLLGTNQSALKDGFRYFYNSIYQFYADERLKRAHTIIKDTNIPFKNVADMCGYSMYTNFSKAFREKFNYSPVSFRLLYR